MRLFTALALGVLVCCAQAQEQKYKVVVQGQEIGEATLIYNILPNRGLRSRLHMRVAGPAGQMTMQVDETTGPDGSPVKGNMQQTNPGGDEKVVRTFTPKGVATTLTKNGKTTTKTYPFPKTGSIKSASTLWFVTLRPKVGAKEVSMSLKAPSMKWEQSTTTYEGIRSIVSQGKTVKAHLISSKETKAWLDDKGVPYQIDLIEEGFVITLLRK